MKYAPTDKTETKGEAVNSEANAGAFEKLPDFGNVFEPYLNGKAPEILESVSTTVADGIVIQEVFYSSYDGKNKICARIYAPETEGKYPGVALYHGGSGNVYSNDEKAKRLAKEGYVVICPELPGIGNPETMKSEGAFKARGYNQQAHIGMYTDPRNSAVFEGILSAIDAFYLLKSLDNVDVEKIGISGGSWGGFVTTKIAGLLGDEVTCAYSLYGCAYYDSGTHWSDNVFPKFGEVNEKLWMTYLDASVTIDNLSAAYFIEAPTNDSFFYPAAVEKTLENIKGEKNKAFVPNYDHDPHVNHTAQLLSFFNYHLKNKGDKLISASDISANKINDDAVQVSFNVPQDRQIQASVYVADAKLHWNDKKWKAVPATIENGRAIAIVPSYLLFTNAVFYGYVADENGLYASTDMITINDLNPREITQAEKIALLEPVIILNTVDEGVTKNGEWKESSLIGYYNGKSVYAVTPEASITYAPLLKEGQYKVSAFVIVHERNQKKITAVVNSAIGESKTEISTQIPESGWVEIGEFAFEDGTSGSVTLSAGEDNVSDAGPLRLDALKFERIENEDSDEVKVILNGEKLNFPDDQKPVIVNGRTLVAFRTIFEALGLSVRWDDITSTAIGEKEGMKIELPIGSTTVAVNGEEKMIDVPAQLINERTFVPLRFLSETVGFDVSWEEATKTVTIKE